MEIRKIAVEILNSLWLSIDFESMSNSRKMSIWDEFSSKVRACSNSSETFEKFIEKFCKKFNIKSLEIDAKNISEVSCFSKEEKDLILKAYREQLSIIMLELRIIRDEKKEAYKELKLKKETKQVKKEIKEVSTDENQLDNLSFLKLTEGE